MAKVVSIDQNCIVALLSVRISLSGLSDEIAHPNPKCISPSSSALGNTYFSLYSVILGYNSL